MDVAGYLKDWIRDNLLSLDSNIANVANILAEEWFVDGNSWYDYAKMIATIIEPMAIVISVVCFLVEFLKITIQMDILKWEYGLRCMLKFLFAKVCIDVSFYLLGAIYATAAEWISSVGASAPTVGSDAWMVIEPIIRDYGTLSMIGVFISMGIVFLAIWLISLVVQVIAYARKFELAVYLAVAPLPCAFLPLEDGGASRIPKHYIMNFASVCLQGLFIIISVRFYGILCVEEIRDALVNGGNVMSATGQLLLGTLVLVMAVVKSSGWAKNVLDVMG